jgi:hypothetical protein
MSPPASYRFIVEADPAPDSLVRILSLFITQGARLESVDHAPAGALARTSIRAAGLAPQQARNVVDRLESLPVVRSVGFGW